MLEFIKNPLRLFKGDKGQDPNLALLTEESAIAEVEKKYKASESTLQTFHRQWFENIAMRRGLQWVQTQSSTKTAVAPPESETRVRITVNKMLGVHQTRLAKLVRDLPQLHCVPASSQEEDKDRARKGTKLLSWVWQDQRVIHKLIDMSSYMIDCGSGFLNVEWDSKAGPTITTYKKAPNGAPSPTGEYEIDEEGYILDKEGERIVDDEVSQGSVCLDFIPSFDVVNDGVSTNIPDSHWIMTVQAMSLEDIRMEWPERGGEVKAEKDLQTRAYYQRRLNTIVSNDSEYHTPDNEGNVPMATVKKYYERKSSKYPNGRKMVIAGGVMLESGSMPYSHGEYPLHKFDDIEVSGAFWGLATMENLNAVQKGYNRTWSQIVENGNNLGNIKVILNKDHGLTKEAYDDSGNEVLEVNQGSFVQQLQPAELPAYVVNQIPAYDKAFEDVSGQHEVSQGKAPEGVKSGRAILALTEQDDSRLAPTKIKFMRTLEHVGVQILQLFEEFQDEDRTYQITGESIYDVDEFTISKADIQAMKKDVRVQSENVIMANKAVQQENILDMYERGLFGDKGDPSVRKRVLELLEFGDAGQFFEEENQDLAMAKAENRRFIENKNLVWIRDPKTGMRVPTANVYEFEDHIKHLKVLNQLRKSPFYQQIDAARRRGIDIHAEQHEMFLRKQSGAPAPEMPPPPGGGMIPPGILPPARRAPSGKPMGNKPPADLPPPMPSPAEGVMPPPAELPPEVLNPGRGTQAEVPHGLIDESGRRNTGKKGK